MSVVPPSQEEILDAALATLTEADVPPDEAGIAGWAGPDCGRPDELADLTGVELEELITAQSALSRSK